MVRLLIDGVFFQLASSGIARVWKSTIPVLQQHSELEVIVLDRGGMPEFPGVETIPFPEYRSSYNADDSILIQKICDLYDIDVFTTTYYTTPLRTPMLMVVYDMIPEIFDFDLKHRFWQEKETAISFARSFLSISKQTKQDLIRFYPEIPEELVKVAYPGVDDKVFTRLPEHEVQEFLARIRFNRNFFLFVGAREQHTGYKNSKLFFEALNRLKNQNFDVLCLGGEEEIDPTILTMLPTGVRAIRLPATDKDLALAYNAAAALIYPSLYEGFGLPVIEAMACGCPVITTKNGSLNEIAPGAAIIIDGKSLAQMASALSKVSDKRVRAELRAKGTARAKLFSWEGFAETLAGEIVEISRNSELGFYDEFLTRWSKLRCLQAEVDVKTIS